jgi:hypothetical protein
MIEKFAYTRCVASSEFLDLNHTRKLMILVTPLIPKLAPGLAAGWMRASESGH